MPHKTYAFVALGIAVFVLISFLIVEALGISLLTDPSDQLDKGGAWAAFLGIGLLLVAILVPVPSSLVMTAQGALYGVALGTLFSWIGSTGAGLMGFWVGRRSSRLINRFVSESERTAANRLIDRWGGFALIASRPLPILAETTAITAGTTSLSWKKAVPAIAIGALPAALIFAIAGSRATSLASGIVISGIVFILAGLFWAAGWLIEQRILDPRRNRATAVDELVTGGTTRDT